MKAITIFPILLLLWSPGIAQKDSRLDDKAGFKQIKIGDIYQKWSKSLTLLTDNDSTKVYSIALDKSIDYIFDQPIEKIKLTFKKHRLVNIEIRTKIIQNWRVDSDVSFEVGMNIFHKFRKQFITMFGDKYGIELSPPAKILHAKAQWVGDKIILDLEYFLNENDFPRDFDYIVVNISDLKYYTIDLDSEGF